MKSIKLKNGLGVGNAFPLRVNCNLGINSFIEEQDEKLKIDYLCTTEKYTPDILMDLSTVKINNPIYQFIISNYNIPVGTVPVYLTFTKQLGIDKNSLLELLFQQAELGVSFFTLHFTADLDLYNKAINLRKIPVTSRGGGLMLADQILKNKNSNLLVEIIDDIVLICNKYNVTISIGTTFRPASIVDACDEIHITETENQLIFNNYLKQRGVNTIIENVGHITIDKLEHHVELLKKFNSPIMPLGPIPTDIAFENDHIAASIGAAFLAYWGCADIINSITPFEHTIGKIDLEATKKGIESAKITSHIINLTRNDKDWKKDAEIYSQRAKHENCLLGDINCNRCSFQCPIKILKHD